MRKLQADADPDDATVFAHLADQIARAREVAHRGVPLKKQEEAAVRALAEAQVKLKATTETFDQVQLAKSRAVAEVDQRSRDLRTIQQQRRSARTPQESFTANAAAKMAFTLSALRNTAMWGPGGEIVAVDPAILESLVTLVAALSEGVPAGPPPSRAPPQV